MGKRKLLSLLLSLMMLSSAIGAPVYADEADNEPIVEETAAAEVVSDEAEDRADETAVDDAEVEPAAVDGDIELLADTVSYPIEKDQTFSFENIGIVAYDISGLNGPIDYVVYYADGSIREYDANAYPSKLSIPAGGKLKVTSTSNTINASLDDDNFIVTQENTPVMNRVTILKD